MHLVSLAMGSTMKLIADLSRPCHLFFRKGHNLVGHVGLEPTTYWLRASYSTIELVSLLVGNAYHHYPPGNAGDTLGATPLGEEGHEIPS